MPKKSLEVNDNNNTNNTNNTANKKSMLLESVCADYITAALTRLLAGDELDSLIGSIVNLKACAAILKEVANYCDKEVRWQERINEVMGDNKIEVVMGDWEQYLGY